MNYINDYYANLDSPVVSREWVELTESERMDLIMTSAKSSDGVSFTRAMDSGYVFVTIDVIMDPGERGQMLLQLEEKLKQEIDNGITIWHEPIGDRNSLRKLRGVEINKT